VSGDALLRLEDALARMLAGVRVLPPEEIALADAAGRILATHVDAVRTLPPWDSSAMDGYAVRAADCAAAGAGAPVRLRVLGEVAAGHAPDRAVAPGTAIRILTGGIVPPGADAVVPVEHTDAPAGVAALPDAVTVLRPARPGDHIRAAGSDLVTGDCLAGPHTRIDGRSIGLLAAAGPAVIPVVRRPRVAVLSTGDELVPVGAPVGPAAIVDSNGLQGATQAAEAGAQVLRLPIVPDRRDAVLGALHDAIARADVVLTSGGVSVGAHDEVRDAFATVGRVDLWRVAIQPGKPIAFGHATAPDGRDVLLFGLPGNPVSAFVTFELFVRPALRRLGGRGEGSGRPVLRARLAESVTKSAGRRAFLRVIIDPPATPGDLPTATLAGGQGSHVLSGLARANGLAIIPEDVDGAAAGTIVDVLRLDEEQP